MTLAVKQQNKQKTSFEGPLKTGFAVIAYAQKPPLNTHADLEQHQFSQEGINFEKFRPPD